MVLNTSLSGQQPPPSQQQSLDMSARHLVMHLAVSVLALVQVSWAVRIAPPAHDVPASNGLKQIHPRLGGRPIHPTWLRSNRIGVKFLLFLLGCADSPVSWPYLGFFVAVSRPAQTDIHPPTIAFDLPRKSGILYFFLFQMPFSINPAGPLGRLAATSPSVRHAETYFSMVMRNFGGALLGAPATFVIVRRVVTTLAIFL
jgi:hypothetical protein